MIDKATVIFLILLVVMVILSIPRAKAKHTAIVAAPRREIEKRTNNDIDIVRKVAEGNERAHRRNHADMCRVDAEYRALRSVPLIQSGPSYPALPDGETVDAEVTDIAGLLP